MRKIFSVLCVVVLIFSLLLGLVGCGEQADFDTLTVYNWADYIYDYEEDFKAYYKAQTGRDIEVTYVTFDTNETMLTKVLKGDSQVDIICPSEYAIQKLLEANMLEKLNYFTDSSYQNSQYVNSGIISKVKQAFDGFTVSGEPVDVTEYLVPYMYGTLGILYNVDVMEEITDNLACGANAVTKKLIIAENRIERYGAPKDVKTYIDKIEKIVEEKNKFFLNNGL